MKYIKPAIEINQTQATQMIAESLNISNDTVNGSEALTKDTETWDIWED